VAATGLEADVRHSSHHIVAMWFPVLRRGSSIACWKAAIC